MQWIKYEQEKGVKEKESKMGRTGKFIHRYMPWNIWTISGPLDWVLRVLEANLREKKENDQLQDPQCLQSKN